jgi:hypothetical protein
VGYVLSPWRDEATPDGYSLAQFRGKRSQQPTIAISLLEEIGAPKGLAPVEVALAKIHLGQDQIRSYQTQSNTWHRTPSSCFETGGKLRAQVARFLNSNLQEWVKKTNVARRRFGSVSLRQVLLMGTGFIVGLCAHNPLTVRRPGRPFVSGEGQPLRRQRHLRTHPVSWKIIFLCLVAIAIVASKANDRRVFRHRLKRTWNLPSVRGAQSSAQ